MLRLSLVASAGSSVPIRAFGLPQLEQTAAVSRLEGCARDAPAGQRCVFQLATSYAR